MSGQIIRQADSDYPAVRQNRLGVNAPVRLYALGETAILCQRLLGLMTPEPIQTLAAHSLNNLRVLNHTAADMLAAAAERNLPRLDESLYFELFSPAPAKPRRNEEA